MHHEMAHAQTQRRDEGYSGYMGSYGESTRGLVNWLSGNGYADSTTGWYEWKYDGGNASAVNASLTRVESFDLDKVWKSDSTQSINPFSSDDWIYWTTERPKAIQAEHDGSR